MRNSNLIKDIQYDNESWGGCETCDYGSRYIHKLEITFNDDEEWNVEIGRMYEYLLSESELMTICLNAKSKEELKNDIIKKIYDEEDSNGYRLNEKIRLEDIVVKINNDVILGNERFG